MKRILLIDGNSLMFRAYYATAYTGNLMQTRSGMYTNAIYGFVNMINKVIESETFDNIFVAFDKGKKTFRHQEYADYKGGRKPMPDEFAMQIPLIKEYLDVLKITRLETDDYEADDLLATMSKKAKMEDYNCLVISGDHDLLQLVDSKVTVALTKKGISELEYYNASNFKDLTGFEPTQLTDFKGLIGDSSDNLPGISGVGEKTAIKLLNEYHTLEGIIENVSNIKGKLSEKIEKDKNVALTTKRLATLCYDAVIDVTIDDTKYQKPDLSALRLFYEKVEFKSFIKRLDSMKEIYEEKKEDPKVGVDLNVHINEVDKFLSEVTNHSNIGIEVELDGLNYHKANLLGFALVLDCNAYYFDKQYIYLDELKEVLQSDKYHFKSTDIKKVYCTLNKFGITVQTFDFDATLAAYVLDPSMPSTDIKYVYEKYEPTKLPYFEEVYGKKTTLLIPSEEQLASYASMKGYYALYFEKVMIDELKRNQQLELLQNIEIPLAIVLGNIELNGFKVNKRRLEEIGLFLSDEIKELENQIYEAVGHEFNIASPKQLGIVLFEELQIDKGKKNKTGYSTSAEVLEKLAYSHTVPRLILDYRKYSKLLSTYVVGLSNEISALDGKVHTTFKQALTATGRLSSTEPNIQNIPVRTEDGRLIRSAFIPSTDEGKLISADYSQIELRILADVSNCEAMINDFNHGMDLHTITAARIYDEPVEEVTKEMRRIAKAVNFGIIYGMSDWGLAEQLHISPARSSEFIRKYFAVYPEIKTYLDKVVEDTKVNGYTTTIFNRRRYIKEINSSNYALREFAKRTAMNAPIQGSAADIIKIAMIKVYNKMQELNLKSKMVAQVHDELIIDTTYDEIEIVKNLLKETMEHAVELKVKMTVDVEAGVNWDLK